MLIAVQLNHPSSEKSFVIGKGYSQCESKIIREWNNDILPKNKRPHYRKFILNEGEYINNLKSPPQKGDLLFWGEWEGPSVFNPLNMGRGVPNGIHYPYHSIVNHGHQNTDPYIFGDYFKYAICNQTGIMYNLDPGSLILFGTTTDCGFILDTGFVVKKHETANAVFKNNAANYSKVYKEETLDRLGNIYLGPNPSAKNKLYHGQTWWDCCNYFSFVPCKIASTKCYGKAFLNIPWLSKQKISHPYKHLLNKNPKDLWQDVVNCVLEMGFLLGVRFYEPKN